MKKIITAILCFATLSSLFFVGNKAASADAVELTEGCKSAYLCDYDSGKCVYSENEKLRVPIASVCKVMTLTLCFEAIEQGKLNLDGDVTVSERAAGMGGSQVFLESGLTYKVSDLLKSIIVCSANDSCVAISEAVCGSEETFVSNMNKRAGELGCTDTLFANCTGLPKETQYSCARDVALMFTNLIRHEEYFKYSKIWLEDFLHPDGRSISITNTNKLIRKYPECDGGKTGFTNQAGFCLASTAKKGDLRLVSVVLGADSSDNRFKSVINMFNYGFSNYKNKTVLDDSVNLSQRLKIENGKKTDIAIRPIRDCRIFSEINAQPEIQTNLITFKTKAPIKKGDVVGKIEVYDSGVLYDTVDVVSSEDAERAGYGDNLKKVAQDWNP